ncbi:ankyrin [Cadophora sp. DSE1049]|nr:ankyrin [Cadophora sp. DSE1049]
MIETFKETFIILDALDECSDLEELTICLAEITSWNLQGLHCLLTSRLETTHGRDSIRAVSICLEPDVVNTDIRRYIKQVLASDTAFKKWKGTCHAESIESKIMCNATGMQVKVFVDLSSMANEQCRFQYAACHLTTLKTCITPSQLNKKLSAMPVTLDGTYERVLRAIPPDYLDFARAALCWLAYACRPLSIAEVVDAMAFVRTEDGTHPEVQFDVDSRLADFEDIFIICSSLITTLDDDKTASKQVRLAHNSIRDYLVSSRVPDDLARNFGMLSAPSHTFIAKDCLAYLLNFESPELLSSESISEFPLARYAAEYWVEHARIGDEAGGPTKEMSINLLLDKKEAYKNWIRLFDPDVPGEGPDLTKEGRHFRSPLYYASLLGLTGTIVKILLDRGADPNSQGGLFSTALQAAAYQGHTRVLDLLLQAGANIDATGGRFDCALSAVSWSGKVESVRFLLSRGANVNLQGPQVGTALQAAALDGHGVEEMIDILLEAKANVNIVAGGSLWFGTALQAAAMSGNLNRVQKLVGAGAKINAYGGRFGYALHAAAEDGADSIVEFLLAKGADVFAEGGEHGSALQAAIHSRRYGVERRLRQWIKVILERVDGL